MDGSEYLYTRWLGAICGFLLLVATVRHYSPRTVLPAESWLLLAGIAYGLLQPLAPVLPFVQLDPEVVTSMVLPVLVFAAGSNMPIPLLLRCSGPIAFLVLVGVPLGALLIGLPAAWLLGIPYAHGLLFGVAVANTDPASVAHVLDRFTIPKRLTVLLEGESIFNDAVTIVLFGALALVVLDAVAPSPLEVAVSAGRSMLLAVPIGLLLGWLAGLLVRTWHEQDRIPSLTLTLILPFAGFLLSERLLHASGIIAVLCSALAFGRTRRARPAPGGRAQLYDEFWEYLGSLAASALYFALGAAVAAQDFPLGWGIPGALLVMLLSRALLVYGAGPLLRLQGRSLPRDWRDLLMLGGLLGPVSAALVLMLPPDYRYRDRLLGLVFLLIAYTLIVHPLLLRAYMKGRALTPLESPDGREPAEAMPPALGRLLERVSWGRAALASLIAGGVFLVMEMTLVPLLQGLSPWAPVRMIAAIGLGPQALPPPASFALDVTLIALVVHFTLALIYGWTLAPVIEGASLAKGVALGMLFGLALYLVNFYLFTLVFPWFAQARNGLTVFAHLVFGLVLALGYLVPRPLSVRDGASQSMKSR